MMWKMVCGRQGLMAAIDNLTGDAHFPRQSASVILFVRS